jgi:1,2-diacylglycerol 3-beta-galactosyltransferase
MQREGKSREGGSVLILMAHTGSGHLRAAEAITEALRRRHGESVSVEIVDALGDYAPFPFSRLADLYPWWINRAALTWRWGYWLTDGRRRATALLRLFWPLVWPRARRLLRHYPADVIVSVHPLTNHVMAWALRRLSQATLALAPGESKRVPLLTLVTDPVSVHPFWLSPGVDRCLVGSAEARRKALACGLAPDRVRVIGLPVNPRFIDGLMDKAQARRTLGWSLDRPVALVVGGGQGMGQLDQVARAIDATCSRIQLAVVAGRNRRLLERLSGTDWRLPTHVYGFVDHRAGAEDPCPAMSCLMSAADLLITKAGPGTVHEAFLAGLPLILSGAIPGQEEGNVRLVVNGGAGVWAPDPFQVAALVARWTSTEDSTLAHMSARSRALARPHAAAAVAEEVWRLITPPGGSSTAWSQR